MRNHREALSGETFLVKYSSNKLYHEHKENIPFKPFTVVCYRSRKGGHPEDGDPGPNATSDPGNAGESGGV